MKSLSKSLFTVITTIFPPGPSMQKLGQRLRLIKSPIIVIGDKKGPSSFDLEGSIFLSLADQIKLDLNIAGLLPTGHYARKNIGYLYAITQGAGCIYETDDDNAPNDFWQVRDKQVCARILKHDGWVNIYKYFTDKLIWPRGLPLDQIHNNGVPNSLTDSQAIIAPIQQGLVDGSPDVDAAWRLILDKDFVFLQKPSVYLEPGAWCPFNTQSTWWWPEAYPLMYLPSHCSFRMCDIWKSFVAQRCLWEMGYGVVFHSPEVYQDRNKHNLMRDFEDEIPGYLNNNRIVLILNDVKLKPGKDNALDNLVLCYEELVKEHIFPTEEMILVKAWLQDLERIL